MYTGTVTSRRNADISGDTNNDNPHGQYGYRGHVINLPQDLTTFATSLPRLPKELDILIVRKGDSDCTRRDFREKVSCARSPSLSEVSQQILSECEH